MSQSMDFIDLEIGKEVRSVAESRLSRNDTTLYQRSMSVGDTTDGFPDPDSMSEMDFIKTLDMRKIIEYRIRGVRIPKIASELGISPGKVRYALNAASKMLVEETRGAAEEIRAVDNERIEMMIIASLKYALPEDEGPPDLAAINTVVKLMERRAKMFGVDDLPNLDGSTTNGSNVDVVHTIARNPETNRLVHELLEHVASISSGTSVDLIERGVQSTETHLTSIFDIGGSDERDQPISDSGDAAETWEDSDGDEILPSLGVGDVA